MGWCEFEYARVLALEEEVVGYGRGVRMGQVNTEKLYTMSKFKFPIRFNPIIEDLNQIINNVENKELNGLYETKLELMEQNAQKATIIVLGNKLKDSDKLILVLEKQAKANFKVIDKLELANPDTIFSIVLGSVNYLILTETVTDNEVSKELIEGFLSESCFTFILDLAENQFGKALGSKVFFLSKEDIEKNESVLPSLEKPIVEAIQSEYLAKQFGVLSKLIDQKLKNKDYELKGKKLFITQEIALISKEQMGSSIGSNSEFRNLLQQKQDSFDRATTDRSESCFAASYGKFYKELEERIETLDSLQQHKKAKKVVEEIPEEFLNDLENKLKNIFYDYANEDLERFNSVLESCIQDAKSALSKINCTLPNLQFSQTTQLEISKYIDQSIQWGRRFESNYAKKKPMEYMMGARMWFMMFMMVMSMLGVSFFQKYKFYFLPLTLSLIGFGIWQMIESQQKEKLENEEKNLEQAKEHLLGEIKRILIDFSRMWEKNLQNKLKDNLNLLNREFDALYSIYSREKKDKLDAEKNRTNILKTSVEQLERQNTRALEDRLNKEKNWQRIYSEISQTFHQNIEKIKITPNVV